MLRESEPYRVFWGSVWGGAVSWGPLPPGAAVSIAEEGRWGGGGRRLGRTGRALLGDLWDRWYPVDPPKEADIVPRQVAILLFQGLSGIKLEYDTKIKQEVDSRAQDGFTAVRESGKRLRVV